MGTILIAMGIGSVSLGLLGLYVPHKMSESTFYNFPLNSPAIFLRRNSVISI